MVVYGTGTCQQAPGMTSDLLWVQKVQLVKALLGQLAFKATQEPQDHKVLLDSKAIRVPQVKLVMMELLV
jgi:hypothetical protein